MGVRTTPTTPTKPTMPQNEIFACNQPNSELFDQYSKLFCHPKFSLHTPSYQLFCPAHPTITLPPFPLHKMLV